MEKRDPLVSIIVRTKDRPELLRKALKSIASQTYRPVEVVLVNDGGCDLPMDELRGVLGDVSLNYIRFEENRGRAAAGNAGIENARGEYIGFLDDDDEFYPDHLSTLVTFLRDSGYKVAYALSEVVKVSFDADNNERVEAKHPALFLREFSREVLLIENYIPLNTLILNKDVLSEVGGLDEELELYEDWDLLIRISEKYPFRFICRTTSKYRHWSSDEQITARKGLAKEPYLKVINKHIHRINPEVMYSAYILGHERKELITQLDMLKSYKEILERQEGIIKELRYGIQEKERMVERLQHHVQEMQEQNRLLLERAANLSTALETVTQTLGWRLLQRYRRLRDRVFKPGTRRGRIYALCIKGLKVIINEGWRSLFRKAIRRLRREHLSRRLHLSGTCRDVRPCETENHFERRPVDIILPVYNSVDLLKGCLESVAACTDLTFDNLIIVDDGSTDERVKEVLGGLDGNGRNVTVLVNDENIGFVRSVNRGMRMSESNDVIILNSDTIVTENWVDKLQRAAYSMPDVATVTPFSNNATICSIPRFLENNQIPEGFDIRSFGRFIEDISLRYYPEIPTGIGFCMYIRRSVLQEVGLFDEEVFGRGYGEENDFCMRAMKRGYRNILDDTTFIYHKGGESFSVPEKTRLEQKGVEIVDSIHPEYLPMVYRFINENPLKPIHDYINLRLNLLTKRSINDRVVVRSSQET